MRKILLVLFTLLLLVGCSSKGYSELSDGNDVLFKGPDGEYTKNDLYKSLKLNSTDAIESDILEKIANTLQVDMSEVEQEAQETLDFYKEMGYESAIISYYGSDENFKQVYISSGIISKLGEKYIDDKFDELVSEDKPVKIQIAYFVDQEKANALIDEVNAGSTFDTAAINQGFESSVEPSVYLDSSDLPIEVKSYLNDTNTLGISTIITVNETSTDADGNAITNSTYYVLNVVSKNVKEFMDEYKEAKLNVLDQTLVKEYMFETHDIEFFDQDIYELMIANYEVLQ